MHNITKVLRAITFAAALSSTSVAWASGFENIIISNTKDADETQTTLPADSAAIYLSAEVTDDIGSGSKITVSWIAVDTNGVAPANYKIDEASFDIGSLEDHVDSSLSKPNAGFPVGKYEAVLSVDGKVMETVDFSIK
ncbi:hypothetical protein GR212_25105 [Rhizobium lusitanum]|uniref:Uncharacterized protein n=1 Tax=Rhizobium lusitanum TaxID=293958 RepID=A0A6L9UB48_9HYPH|nr:hypothetical protein [Rhizobium lusitanum]NEI72844.1 hypothetical protein [Rhizobium lusitanum]